MKPICIFLLVFLLLSGCEDIFEQDIEDASIEVIAPKNNTRTEAGTVTFLWRPLDGARSYRLTIVSPTFAGASRLVADTTLLADSAHRADRFTATLDTGNYQWSLQAANGAFRNKEQVYTLTVDPPQADEPSELPKPDQPSETEETDRESGSEETAIQAKSKNPTATIAQIIQAVQATPDVRVGSNVPATIHDKHDAAGTDAGTRP